MAFKRSSVRSRLAPPVHRKARLRKQPGLSRIRALHPHSSPPHALRLAGYLSLALDARAGLWGRIQGLGARRVTALAAPATARRVAGPEASPAAVASARALARHMVGQPAGVTAAQATATTR